MSCLIAFSIVRFAAFNPRTFENASNLSPWIVSTGFRFNTVPSAAAAAVILPPFFRYFKVSTVI